MWYNVTIKWTKQLVSCAFTPYGGILSLTGWHKFLNHGNDQFRQRATRHIRQETVLEVLVLSFNTIRGWHKSSNVHPCVVEVYGQQRGHVARNAAGDDAVLAVDEHHPWQADSVSQTHGGPSEATTEKAEFQQIQRYINTHMHVTNYNPTVLLKTNVTSYHKVLIITL